MKWTREVPTAVGLYWVRRGDHHDWFTFTIVNVIQCEDHGGCGHLYAEQLGERFVLNPIQHEFADDAEWYGPLVPPGA